MLKRPLKSLIARIAIIALVLSLVVPFVPAAFAQSTPKAIAIDYAENGTAAVTTFHAEDQDGDPIAWSLDGVDKALFTIEGGELAFKDSPDFEAPAGGSNDDSNTYEVTIKATGGSQDVDVNVTDVDEAGSASLDRPQPQVGRDLTASFKDADLPTSEVEWQWAGSADGQTWTDIEGATSNARSPSADDTGNYLRATVTYTDKFSAGKTVSVVSDNPVETRTLANTKPSFVGQDGDKETEGVQASRKVDENSAKGTGVGDAVSATDADNDVLIYSLEDGDLEDGDQDDNNTSSDGDSRHFTIDRGTGQIKVANAKLNYEVPESDADNNTYQLKVIATDPSGASADVVVAVTVEDVNEAPKFTDASPRTVEVTENQGNLDGDPEADGNQAPTYEASDGDNAGVVADPDEVRYTIEESDDSKYFDIDATTGVLTIETEQGGAGDDDFTPNFEKQSSYSITVVATSKDALPDTAPARPTLVTKLDVTVKVLDSADDGSVGLSQREPQVGRVVNASVSDSDSEVTATLWQWFKGITAGEEGSIPGTPDFDNAELCPADDDAKTVIDTLCRIDGATSSTYTPAPEDVGESLIARVTYKDAQSGETRVSAEAITQASVQVSDPANTAPKFGDQDPNTLGDQTDETSREVAENADEGVGIGEPVVASDGNKDRMIYTLSGSDADSFSIDSGLSSTHNDGQLRTKAELDYETKSSYTVVVTATDPSGATDSITVTINVTDENDPATITADGSVDYPENGADPVATYTAIDQDGDPIAWSLDGVDKALFTIEGGELAFKDSPDFEAPAGGSNDDSNTYEVTIKATGGSQDVDVNVTDVDEAGSASLDRPQPQVGRDLTASFKDADLPTSEVEWQWAGSADGQTWTDIEGATSNARSPSADDTGNYLRATVTYTDKFSAGKTVSVVSDNPVETRTLANTKPSFVGQDGDKETEGVQASRKVDENSAKGTGVGDAVSATDADNDVLIYSLEDGDLEDGDQDDNNTSSDGDSRHFTIDRGTGQIKVANAKLNYEVPESDADNNTYQLKVIATDPSGASADVVVAVTVEDVNEAPKFTDASPRTVEVTENQGNLDGDPEADGNQAPTYEASDGDNAGVVADPDEVRYTIEESDDSKYFDIDATTGVLTIETEQGGAGDDDFTPNFEKQSSYSITVVATSKDALPDTAPARPTLVTKLDVTVKVLDSADDGSVGLSQREPQVGRVVNASVSDSDSEVTATLWQWFKGITAGEEGSIPGTPDFDNAELCPADDDAKTVIDTLCRIDGATSSTYTPAPEDVGESLIARVTYKDAQSGETRVSAEAITQASVQVSDPANTAPKFGDQDPNTLGDQTDETSREVAENADEGVGIGEPVVASDGNKDRMIYTLSGSDADSFSIDSGLSSTHNDGQLRTKAELDYETKSSYTVVVTATDPSGATDSITVTINVTDENDGAIISLAPPVPPTPPIVAVDGSVTLSSDSPAVGEAITATLEDGNEETGVTWQWSNHTPGDEEWADIEGATDASYTPTNDDHGKHVRATASYSDDSSDEGQSAMAATANLVNNAPAFEADSAALSVDENAEAMAAVGDPVVATDVNEEELTYAISGDDAASFEISSSGQITVAPDAVIDYETKTGYSVTVTATDAAGASDSIDVAISVNDLGLTNPYDSDDSGDISKDEAVQAAQDYFADTITRGEVLEVLQFYFAG